MRHQPAKYKHKLIFHLTTEKVKSILNTEKERCLFAVTSALTFRDFVPRLELLSPLRDFLGI